MKRNDNEYIDMTYEDDEMKMIMKKNILCQ